MIQPPAAGGQAAVHNAGSTYVGSSVFTVCRRHDTSLLGLVFLRWDPEQLKLLAAGMPTFLSTRIAERLEGARGGRLLKPLLQGRLSIISHRRRTDGACCWPRRLRLSGPP